MSYYDKCKEYENQLSDDLKPYAKKVMVQGRMGGRGHNNRYFIIDGDYAIKISWGDFSEDHVHYPMLFESTGHPSKILKIYDTVYVAPENFADYNDQKNHCIKDFDFTMLNKKYEHTFDPVYDEVYDAAFIIQHSKIKIEKGEWYERDFKTKEYLKQELKLGRLFL